MSISAILERHPHKCPTCGRPFPPRVEVGGTYRQRMFDYVVAHPEGVTVQQIMYAVYHDVLGGGPEHPRVVAVMGNAINKKLRPFGYEIKGTGGPGSRYYLRELLVQEVA